VSAPPLGSPGWSSGSIANGAATSAVDIMLSRSSLSYNDGGPGLSSWRLASGMDQGLRGPATAASSVDSRQANPQRNVSVNVLEDWIRGDSESACAAGFGNVSVEDRPWVEDSSSRSQ